MPIFSDSSTMNTVSGFAREKSIPIRPSWTVGRPALIFSNVAPPSVVRQSALPGPHFFAGSLVSKPSRWRSQVATSIVSGSPGCS